MEGILERTINYYETDAMGIVHHSNYYRFFEEGRIRFLIEVGLPYDVLEKMGIMVPVLETHCHYKIPAKFADTVIIKTTILECKGIRMRISYEVTNKETGNVIALGETVHCFTDFNLKPINIKKHYPDVYEKFSK